MLGWPRWRRASAHSAGSPTPGSPKWLAGDGEDKHALGSRSDALICCRHRNVVNMLRHDCTAHRRVWQGAKTDRSPAGCSTRSPVEESVSIETGSEATDADPPKPAPTCIFLPVPPAGLEPTLCA